MNRLDTPNLEAQIALWRTWVKRRGAGLSADVDELEDHLRSQVAELKEAALNDDEAFLVAVKRMGSLDALSREFAREQSERLWKQLVLSPTGDQAEPSVRRDVLTALAFAAAAAVAVKLPAAFGVTFGRAGDTWYLRNLGLSVLPFLAGWFAWRRRVAPWALAGLSVPAAAGALVVNLYPFQAKAQTLVLAAVHLPIVLWSLVGAAYAGMRWRSASARMDFVRFTGEWVIYYALIALGGGVLVGLTIGVFSAIGMNVEAAVAEWIIPAGAAGAVVVAALLVEAKQSVIENMAPVLTKVFTPLFALLSLAFLGAMAWSGSLIDIQREALILFDLLLVAVLGLALYAISARDPLKPPGGFDRLQLALVCTALLVDLMGLAAMLSRMAVWGPSPNKVAALGLNFLLLVNLGRTAWLLGGFLRGRRTFANLESWQTNYLPVYPAWAAAVVIVLPPLFRFA